MIDPFRDQYTKIPNTLYYKIMTKLLREMGYIGTNNKNIMSGITSLYILDHHCPSKSLFSNLSLILLTCLFLFNCLSTITNHFLKILVHYIHSQTTPARNMSVLSPTYGLLACIKGLIRTNFLQELYMIYLHSLIYFHITKENYELISNSFDSY